MSAHQDIDKFHFDVSDEERALDWARRHFSVDGVKRLKQAPWGHVYSLHTERDSVILKITRPHSSAEPDLLPVLSSRHPEHTGSVLASDTAYGYLLLRLPTGQRLDYDIGVAKRSLLLSSYASLQAACVHDDPVQAVLQLGKPSEQVSALLAFLSGDARRSGTPGVISAARDILGASAAERWHSALGIRAELLESFVSAADRLPTTLNHGDLRPPNAIMTSDTRCALIDWNSAIAGPAGWSLHGLFSGCSQLTRLLLGDHPGDSQRARQPQRVLEAYIEALVSAGYADQQTLRDGLAASACAGQMHYIAGYSRYSFANDELRKDIAQIIDKRLTDLLDLTDYLVRGNSQLVSAHTSDHIKHKRTNRAATLLRRHLRQSPNDAAAHTQYAGLLQDQGSYHRARRHYQEVLDITPDQPAVLSRLGDLHLERLEYTRAIRAYRRAMHLTDGDEHTRASLNEAFELQRAETSAERDDTLPRLMINEAEFASGQMSRAKSALATRLMLEYGTLVIENVFDTSLIDACREHFYTRYASYFDNRRHEDALRIGDMRFQVTLDIEGPYNSQAFLGNPLVLPLLESLLDKKMVLGSVTAATSLPGSKEQWLHKDHPRIFSRRSESLITPPAGVSLMTPLVDLHEAVGTTKVKKKSHLVSLDESRSMPSLSPYLKAGSCFFMDHRLSHKGEPNQGNQVRPIINSLYHRRWFRDSLNFHNQPPIRVSAEELERVPKHLQHLLKWTRDPGPRD